MTADNAQDRRHALLQELRIDRMLDLIRMPLCITDPNLPDNPIIYANDAFLGLTGYGRDEVVGRNCRFLQGPGTTAQSVQKIRDAVRSGATGLIEIINYRKNGESFVNSLQISPILDGEGKVALMFGSQLDVTHDHSRQQEQHKLAADELIHRLRNIVNVMSSVIRLTEREIPDRGELLDKIQQRLRALSDSHFSVMRHEEAQSLDTLSICQLVVAPYAPEAPGSLRVSGLAAEIAPGCTSPLALALHELAANAAKHGAFSVSAGKVTIDWTRDDTDRLQMIWTERGGPEPARSSRESGSKMIVGLIEAVGGTLRYDWQRAGLVARITLPPDR